MIRKEKRNHRRRTRSMIDYLILLISVLIVAAILLWPTEKESVQEEVFDFSQMTEISELATTKSYYHNVVEIEDNPKSIFKFGLFRYGYKRFWMEYTGQIRMGVDASKITITKPDEDNVVRIYLPDAEVLDATVAPESMSDPIVETGIFTTITAEEQSAAIKSLQQDLIKEAQKDTKTLKKSKMLAGKIIENCVQSISDTTGIDYTIEWINE